MGDTGAEGDAPDAIEEAVGTEVEIPVNRTVYLEGKTLTGWTDGTDTFDIGSKYTVQDDVTLTPVFAENTEALSGTVVYDFRDKMEHLQFSGRVLISFFGISSCKWFS